MNEKHQLAAIARGVVIAKRTDAFVLSIARLIDEAIASGHETDIAVATYLNERGFRTRANHRRSSRQQVKNTRARLERLRKANVSLRRSE